MLGFWSWVGSQKEGIRQDLVRVLMGTLTFQISTKVTAGDVCSFAAAHKKLAQTPDKLALFEVVCNGQLGENLHLVQIWLAPEKLIFLERILGVDEKLLDVVSRWTSWPLEERATSYWIVKVDHFKQRMESMVSLGRRGYP